MCGEQMPHRAVWRLRAGSPPRVRGTAFIGQSLALLFGITPACAGNSIHHPHSRLQKEDHPRVCGEQGRPCGVRHQNEGSPPRVRGTAVSGKRPDGRKRITPACAGNRDQEREEIPMPEDHPRVCGEQLVDVPVTVRFVGSPPRVRGTGSYRL